MTKRRQVRKVATMVKRLKKNPEDVEQQPLAEAGASLASKGGWDAQQQATVAAYAQSRGMQPREVLQALVISMEKTLRKEKGENLASQTSSLGVNQREEAAGRPETRPNPRRGGRDLREKKADSNCVACCKDKKKGGTPEDQVERRAERKGPKPGGARQREPVSGDTRAGKDHRHTCDGGQRNPACPERSPEKCRRPEEGGRPGTSGMRNWSTQRVCQRGRAGACDPFRERWQDSARDSA